MRRWCPPKSKDTRTEPIETPSQTRIRFVNPNSSEEVTARMAAAARATLGAGWHVEATTIAAAPAIITDEPGLALATELVVSAFEDGLDPLDGVIVSAFADPGLDTLRGMLDVPVVGIAEAAMRAAARLGRFAVISPTPELADVIRGLAARYGLTAQLAEIVAMTADRYGLLEAPQDLFGQLRELVTDLLARGGLEAVIIGGGPLVGTAQRLSEEMPDGQPCPIIDPIVAAAQAMRGLIGPQGRA